MAATKRTLVGQEDGKNLFLPVVRTNFTTPSIREIPKLESLNNQLKVGPRQKGYSIISLQSPDCKEGVI
jgi:hypothetical protein